MNLINWALAFLFVALVAALFGFGGIAGTAAGIAKTIFVAFLVLVVTSLVVNFTRRANDPWT